MPEQHPIPLAPRRLLVRGVNWLGDAVMSLAAMQRLREALPQTHIALLTQAKLAGLWQGQPCVDEVIPFEKADGVWRVARRLRTSGFDTALILPNSTRSALEAWLARVPRRIGVARTGRNWLLTQRVPPRASEIKMHKRSVAEINRLLVEPASPAWTVPSSAHHIHQYLHLASALGASPEPVRPCLKVTEADAQAVSQRFGWKETHDIEPPLFGLNPGAEYGPAKRWPSECFVQAAVELHRRTGCRWWVFGGPADRTLAERLSKEICATAGGPMPIARSLAGETSLRELCAAMKCCRVVLTNDTGPMHLAAAVGVPVVVPFGSTSPELTGPGLPGDARHHLLKSDAPCAPCFLRECPIDFRCMKGIPVDRVVAAVIEASAGHVLPPPRSVC